MYINLSGGIDSVYYLWRLLQENPDKKILVHHCLLFENRKKVEKKATDDVLEYFRSNNLANFEYTETKFSRMGIKGTIYDIEPLYFLSGMILKSHKAISDVYIPICKEELAGSFKKLLKAGKSWVDHEDPKDRFYKCMVYCNTMARRKLNYHTPYWKKTKKDMIREMPQELFELTWFCRKPREGVACGKCFNCKRVHRALL